MSYLFFLVVGLAWGLMCGFCDSRGIMRNDRNIMQLICGLLGYGVGFLLFLGQPAGGLWFFHLIIVIVVSGLVHNYSRAKLFNRRG